MVTPKITKSRISKINTFLEKLMAEDKKAKKLNIIRAKKIRKVKKILAEKNRVAKEEKKKLNSKLSRKERINTFFEKLMAEDKKAKKLNIIREKKLMKVKKSLLIYKKKAN